MAGTDPSDGSSGAPRTSPSRASPIWPVLLVMSLADGVGSIYTSVRFEHSCRELGCIGLIFLWGAIGVSIIAAVIAALGWRTSMRWSRGLRWTLAALTGAAAIAVGLVIVSL